MLNSAYKTESASLFITAFFKGFDITGHVSCNIIGGGTYLSSMIDHVAAKHAKIPATWPRLVPMYCVQHIAQSPTLSRSLVVIWHDQMWLHVWTCHTRWLHPIAS
jgi:hypothetical protein